MDFREKTVLQILQYFENTHFKEGAIVTLEVFNSDLERIGYKSFIDLAQLFFLKMLTPTSYKDETTLRFVKLSQEASFHKSQKNTETYGVQSEFFAIDKMVQFSFLYHYQKALQFIDLKNRKTILNLGINKGDEFRVIKDMLSEEEFSAKELLGIDYSASAIAYAEQTFSHRNTRFVCHDINTLHELSLGRFELFISIGTLQSSNINFNETFMSLYQNHLEKEGAIILGFPNCRWVDGEMIYGAKAPNYNFSEMSLVLKDIHFCKKYLQQKKYRVVITGKDYLFLSARKIMQ